MNIDSITAEFREMVCKEIRLQREGINRYIVFTPFMFDDGDHLPIVLRQEEQQWYLTDEAHTFMHVSYDEIDVECGTRSKIIDKVLLSYGIKNIKGELRINIENEAFGDAIYSFIQGLIKITDISYLKRERVLSTFIEDFRLLLEENIIEEKRIFNYSDKQHDPDRKYIVDCRIDINKHPLFMFAIPNDDKCRDATITCLQHEEFGASFIASAIFEDHEEINRRVLARFSDVCEKQFPSLQSAKERFNSYLNKFL